MTTDNQFQQNQKLWGVSQHLFVGANTDLAIAYGKAGGASSLHYHAHKHNTFVVLSGEVVIRKTTSDMAKGSRLLALDSYTVSAGVPHRMVFVKDTVLHELYVAVDGYPIEMGDIVRLEPGWEPPCKQPSE